MCIITLVASTGRRAREASRERAREREMGDDDDDDDDDDAIGDARSAGGRRVVGHEG